MKKLLTRTLLLGAALALCGAAATQAASFRGRGFWGPRGGLHLGRARIGGQTFLYGRGRLGSHRGGFLYSPDTKRGIGFRRGPGYGALGYGGRSGGGYRYFGPRSYGGGTFQRSGGGYRAYGYGRGYWPSGYGHYYGRPSKYEVQIEYKPKVYDYGYGYGPGASYVYGGSSSGGYYSAWAAPAGGACFSYGGSSSGGYYAVGGYYAPGWTSGGYYYRW